jgi:hypothetical protein
MSKEKSPKKETKKLSKIDKKELEQKNLKQSIKEEKYKALGYLKTKEKYED